MGEIVAIISPGKRITIKAIIDALYEENIDFTVDDDGIEFKGCKVKVIDRTNEKPVTYGMIEELNFSLPEPRKFELSDYIEILPACEDELKYSPEVPRMNKQLIKQYNHRTNDILRRYNRKPR